MTDTVARMKRCPVEQGGCGQLVEMLFDSGLCTSCDAAVKRGTAAVTPAERCQLRIADMDELFEALGLTP